MDSDSRTIEVLVEAGAWPDLGDDIEGWVRAAADAALATDLEADGPIAMNILLTDDAAVRELNRNWRGQDKATNVLSFPMDEDVFLPEDEALPLGDIAIAHETLRREAVAEGKTDRDHLAHLVVHGTLHLLGYDHLTATDAQAMEALERQILAGLGIADPYADSELLTEGVAH